MGADFGLAIAALVLAYGYLPHVHDPAINSWVIFAACPPSIVLMAAHNAKWYVEMLAHAIIIVVNAVWYGFLFAVAARLVEAIR